MRAHRIQFMPFLVALAFLAVPGIAAAQTGDDAPRGVQFLSDKAQAVTLAEGEQQATLTVKAINGGTATQSLTLEVIGLVDAEGASLDEQSIDPCQESSAVAVGQVCAFELTFTRQ